jgi:sterol 3beta-glucosyltransferase
MRVALLTSGSRGDMQPMLAVAMELSRRGHQVVLVVNENFVEWLGTRPFEILSFPVDSEGYLRSAAGQALIARGQVDKLFRETNRIELAVNDAITDVLVRAVKGADLILATPLSGFRSKILAEKFDIPAILLGLQPPIGSRDTAHWAFPVRSLGFGALNLWTYDFVLAQVWRAMRPALDQMRGSLGMAPETQAFKQADFPGTISLYSQQLFPRPEDWDARHQVAGFAPLRSEDRGGAETGELPADLETWLDKDSPPVFFGFGSMPVSRPQGLLRDIEHLCQRLGVRALIGSGWTDYGQSSDERVFIVGPIDHDRVLPRCRAAVHHGGAGTTHAALRAGLPSLIGSFFVDQPSWGRAVKRLGVGDTIPFDKLNSSRLLELLPPLLTDAMQARARELGAIVRREDGASRAADLIEAQPAV